MTLIIMFLEEKTVQVFSELAKIVITCYLILFYLTQLIVLSDLSIDFVVVDNEIRINTFEDVKH